MAGSETPLTDQDCAMPLAPAVRLGDEGLLGLDDLRREFSPGGCPIDRASIYRWITRGYRGVRLPALRLGRRWFSTVEALEWFVAATTAMNAVPSSRVGARGRKPRQREHARNVDELRAYGFTVEEAE